MVIGPAHIPILGTLEGALEQSNFDVMVDFASPSVAKKDILLALGRGKRVVVGACGLTGGIMHRLNGRPMPSNPRCWRSAILPSP